MHVHIHRTYYMHIFCIDFLIILRPETADGTKPYAFFSVASALPRATKAHLPPLFYASRASLLSCFEAIIKENEVYLNTSTVIPRQPICCYLGADNCDSVYSVEMLTKGWSQIVSVSSQHSEQQRFKT
jgi:hypothetical protein